MRLADGQAPDLMMTMQWSERAGPGEIAKFIIIPRAPKLEVYEVSDHYIGWGLCSLA